MTITIVCDILGEENNGTTIAAINLIRYLRAQGHTVRILCADEDKQGQENYYIVPSINFGIFNGYLAENGVKLAKPVRRVIEAALEGTDIVHIMLPFALGQASAKIAQKKGIPLSAGFHLLSENFSTHIFMKRSRLVNRLTYAYFNKMYRRCDTIHYVSPYIRSLWEGMYGQTNGYVISNGVNASFYPDPSKRRQENEKFVILYTGRYSKEKAHSVLLRAVNLSAHREQIQLVLAGDGPMRRKLERQAKKLPVPPILRFFSREEMVIANNSADLYVHAAQYEAEGIGCLEAIACGVVPIICDSGKCATRFYALDEKSLFRPGDGADLAAKIDWWIDHPAERAAWSTRYANLSREKFDHAACMARMEEMLAQTIKSKKEKAM